MFEAKQKLEEKYEKLGHYVNASYDGKKVIEIQIVFPEYNGNSSAEIFLDVLNKEGEYLGACCANISRVRDILFGAVRENGMIRMAELHEIYYLLDDHGCFEHNDDANEPLNHLKNLWLLVKDDAELDKVGRETDPNDLEDALDILGSSCSYLRYSHFFDNHPYEDTEADRQQHIAKIIPAVKTVFEKIQSLNKTVETYALLKEGNYLENRTGYVFFKTEDVAKQMVEEMNKNDEPKYSYKKVKISLEKGIENFEQ